MALAIVQVYSRSAWRARVTFSGGDPSTIVPADFSVTRQDGGPCTVAVASILVVDTAALELIFDERIIARVIYLLHWNGAAIPFSDAVPAAVVAVKRTIAPNRDAEANGVDLAWLSSDITPGGRFRRSGLACVQYDLMNRAMLRKGDLVQAQDAGGNLPEKVNGSAGDLELLQIGSDLEAEFRRDPRVADASVDPVIGDNGGVDFNGQVQTRAGQSAPVRST